MCANYASIAADDEVLKAALHISESTAQPLTLSFGVLFAKQGYPFEAQLHLAEKLVKSAKDERRRVSGNTGFIDYHWMESSGRQELGAIRKIGFGYHEGNQKYRLFTRPWPWKTAQDNIERAEILLTEIARRKLHQLDAVLRMGGVLSELAWHQWNAGLDTHEKEALQKLSLTDPWIDERGMRHTELLELAELAEILTVPEKKEVATR